MSDLIEFREPTSLGDWLAMRSIRNECRFFMTNDQSKISLRQQWRFYRMYKRSKNRYAAVVAYLFGTPVGFGLISWDDGMRAWISGGVMKKYRSQGIGRDLFYYLSSHALPRPAFLEVLKTNQRAYRLYESLGWTEQDEKSTPYGPVLMMIKE